jgi:hypothetical protein
MTETSPAFTRSEITISMFLCDRRLFIEQVALLADDVATEARLHQFVAMETLAGALAAFAAGPFAAGAVGDRPTVACLIADWLGE